MEFALRLIEVYKCYTLYDAAVRTLQHSSLTVRLQALQVLKENGNHTSTKVLTQHFAGGCKEEQMVILCMLNELGAGNNELPFLTMLLPHQDEVICYHAMHLIQQISPAWSTVVIRRIKDN